MTEPSPEPQRGNLDKLVRRICMDRGLDLGHYRRSFLERRVAARLRALNLITYRQYADVLDRDPDEYAHFLQVLTINVTEFFRDPEVWDLLRTTIIPELLAAKAEHGGVVRVWSAGCATGEEPYTLAMMFLESMGAHPNHHTVAIHATDIDPDALAVAQRGIYSTEKRQQIPADLRLAYTLDVPDDESRSFQIAPGVSRLVHFQPFSLFDSPPMKLVDLVVCRNVFIYFDRDEQSRVLDGFWHAMTPAAYLVLGRSEKLAADAHGRFHTVDSKERVYRRTAGE